jgi:O-succinylbenzoate synthase
MVNQEDIRLSQELKRSVVHRQLIFKKPAKTSRDTMRTRDIWYLILSDKNGVTGIGECAPIPGLSAETKEQTEFALKLFSENCSVEEITSLLATHSSFACAFETAILDYRKGGNRQPFGVPEQPIAINGLVWMNGREEMLREAHQKIADGFTCVKLKIGSLAFEEELGILQELRSVYSPDKIEIRLDANGAFTADNVLQRLEALAKFTIHSIEQPIRQKQWTLMREVITQSPIPIALDEELIGVSSVDQEKLLETLRPHYLILKPSLHGGFSNCDNWIKHAANYQIQWWSTSALESNIGLNAIAQWAGSKSLHLPQGLGTGGLFENNIPSPIEIKSGFLHFNDNLLWEVSSIFTGLSPNEKF